MRAIILGMLEVQVHLIPCELTTTPSLAVSSDRDAGTLASRASARPQQLQPFSRAREKGGASGLPA